MVLVVESREPLPILLEVVLRVGPVLDVDVEVFDLSAHLPVIAVDANVALSVR